jgi:hypothetical protein
MTDRKFSLLLLINDPVVACINVPSSCRVERVQHDLASVVGVGEKDSGGNG